MSYECADCNRSFDTSQGLFSHCNAKGHSVYECFQCGGKIFKNERALEKHHQAVHLSFCHECDRNFCDERALSQHLQNSPVHNRLPECIQCSRLFKNDAALDQHLRYSFAHRTIISQRVNYAHHISASSCYQCQKAFKDELALNQHLRDSPAHKQVFLVSTSRNTFCHICEKGFNTPADLQRHNASPVHRPRAIDCFICPSKFKTPSGLAHHVESSCPSLPYNRHQVTAAIQDLNIIPTISLRSVTEGSGGVTPIPRPLITYQATEASFNGSGYLCSVCDRTFRTLHSLEAHLNSPAHDDDEFKCPKCHTQFKLISGLVQHLESNSCGLSSVDGVEGRFRKMMAQFSRALKL